MNNQRGYTLYELIFVGLFLFGGFGWVWNIVKIAQTDFAHITGMLVLRVVGIFIAPLGAVVGYF